MRRQVPRPDEPSVGLARATQSPFEIGATKEPEREVAETRSSARLLEDGRFPGPLTAPTESRPPFEVPVRRVPSVGDARPPQARPITPRRTTTRRHHTQPGTWSEERILVALRGWTREVGLPPRSYEWCPASARGAGLIGPGESKWEREHPRWPGNTTVYRYFDSWAAALEAAGIRPIWPARPPGTVAERVAAALRLERDGLGALAIADAIGVRPDTVRRYLKAHPCRSCGDPVSATPNSATSAPLARATRNDGAARR
jgi:hypothetical protein